MSSKTNFFSRQETQCDHCGLKVNRHNLAAHTRTVHPKQKVKERAQNMKTLDSLFPVSKKARLDEEGEGNSDYIDTTEPSTNENIPENIPENVTENIPGNEDILNKLSEVQASVLKSIDDLKQDIIKTNKDKDVDECDPKEFSSIDNARIISELISACPELEHISNEKYIKCKLCVDLATFDYNNKQARQTIGIIKYNEDITKLRDRDDLMDRDFRNIKIAVKKHLNSHTQGIYT